MEYRFVYQLYATRADGFTHIKTVKRKNCLSEETQRYPAGNFADKIAHEKHTQVVLCGSNRMDPNNPTEFFKGASTVLA